ncbi:MAG: hypothetical protein ACO1QR_07975 [Chthoniobacteraceae bacterium]
MSPSLRSLNVAVFAALACCSIAHAQTAGPSIQQLESLTATRQARVDLLREEIQQTNERIESRVDMLIATLTSITDSKESRTKVARMKEDTMRTLGKTIQYYDQKRATFRQELRNPSTTIREDEKKKIIAAFDALIEKRTRQILALKKSMPTHKDYERYKATGSDWNGTTYERNKDFEQNRRMTSHSNTQNNALVKELDASIARLDRSGRALRTELAATKDPALRKSREADIAKNDALIAERRRQKLEVAQSSDKAQRGVALKEAMDLDASLKRAIADLRRDFTMLFERYHAFVRAVSDLHATEATLAAARKGA